MTNVASNTPAAKPAETRQIVLKEISAKRGRFSEQDFSALKGKEDLVTYRGQVQPAHETGGRLLESAFPFSRQIR